MTTHRFPLDGPINLQVRIGHGSVLVETADELSEATVELNAAPDVLDLVQAELQGRTLSVNGPRQGGMFDLGFLGRRHHSGKVDVRVLVPTGTAVKIGTFTAPIRIAGTVGGADLSFATGEAAVRRVLGDVRLRFGSGTAKVVHADGAVEVRSGAGNASFGEVGGDLSVGCGSGDVRARVTRGAVRVRAGSGSAQLDEVHGDVDVASGSGQVEIGVPAGVTARIEAHSGSGRVHSEVPLAEQAREPRDAISVRARTGHGNVRVFRPAAPSAA